MNNSFYSVRVKNIGFISVVDRVTGFGYGTRDIETGFRAKGQEDHKLLSKPGEAKRYADFWLASGNFDIRNFKGTYREAIEHIKDNANTCIGELRSDNKPNPYKREFIEPKQGKGYGWQMSDD